MQPRTRRCCNPVNNLYLWFIGVQFLVFFTLGLALFVRFRINGVQEFFQLPSDQRVIVPRHSSLFCEKHTLKSLLVKNNGLTNSDRHFDLYALDDDPKGTLNTSTKVVNITGRYGLDEGGSKTYTMHLNKGSVTSFRLCDVNDVTTTTGIWVKFCIAKGRSHQKKSDRKFCQGGIQKGMMSLGLCNATLSVEFTATLDGDYSVTIWNHFNSTPAAFQITFIMTRKLYDVPEKFSRAKHSIEERTSPYKVLVVEFNHWESKPDNYLDEILLEYSCTPKINVYFGLFFGIPLAILTIMSVIVLCMYNRHDYEVL